MSIYSYFDLTEDQEKTLIKEIDETGNCYNTISKFIGSVTIYEKVTKDYLLEKLIKSVHLTAKVARLVLLQSDFKLTEALQKNIVFGLLLLEDPGLMTKPPEKQGYKKYIFPIPSPEERARNRSIRELNITMGYTLGF